MSGDTTPLPLLGVLAAISWAGYGLMLWRGRRRG